MATNTKTKSELQNKFGSILKDKQTAKIQTVDEHGTNVLAGTLDIEVLYYELVKSQEDLRALGEPAKGDSKRQAAAPMNDTLDELTRKYLYECRGKMADLIRLSLLMFMSNVPPDQFKELVKKVKDEYKKTE